MFNLFKYNQAYEGLMEVKGDYVAYAVTGEAHDYVQETSERIRQLAQRLYKFPFYLHFESYDESQEEVLSEKSLEIQYKPSGRTVLRQTGQCFNEVEVPSYTVKIHNEQQLNQAFALWFHYASNNDLWALTQEDCIVYENGFATLEMTKDMTLLVTEHDAYGFTFLTNENIYKAEVALRRLLANM